MSKTQKGTRISGLPARVLLSLRQDATGSYPVSRRTASDNRTGKYSAFFPDTKTIAFNQQVDGTGLQPVPVDTLDYIEDIFEVSSPTISQVIPFGYAFAGTPVVVIEKLTSTNNSEGVNPFVEAITATTFTVGFSAPFAGTVKFRAITASNKPQLVQRTPLYSGKYTSVVSDTSSIKSGGNTTYFTQFNLFEEPLDLKELFITFYDSETSGEADMSASIGVQTSTYIAITSSANVANKITAQFLGYADSHATIGVNGIVYPLGLTSASINSGLSETNRLSLFRQPFLSDGEVKNLPISAPGKQLKGIADSFITFTPGQDLQPFMDSGNPAVDGKLSSSIGGVNAFYATGSAVEITGPGFQQPLWSKSKIEIDITPAATQTFTASFGYTAAGSYPMFYWNPSTKQYEGLGNGVGLESDTADLAGLKNFLEEKPIGFGGCLDSGGLQTGLIDYAFKIRTRPISNFGFPYHPKFEATSSQLIDMNNYISEPFLLEKILLEFSGSISIPNSPSTNSCIQTFFLLNQRSYILSKSIGEQIISYATGTLLAPWTASFTTSSYSGQTYRDLVDYMQVAFYRTDGYGPNGLAQSPRELNFFGTPDAIGPTNFIISSSCKSPIKFEEGLQMFFSGAAASSMFFVEKNEFPGRNGVYEVNGREWVTSYENPKIVGTGSYALGSGPLNIININEAYTKLNPYILLPTDKLTFGGQLPLSIFGIGVGNRSSITFSPQGINKITLYGSSLRVNPETNQLEEYHDTLNQLLSSNSIHEIIGEP